MRLLHTSGYHLKTVAAIEQEDPWETPKYAILSHRWVALDKGGEITFRDLDPGALTAAAEQDPDARRGGSSAKIRGACKKAKQHSLDWIWIDTVCIDKSNATELSTALNSMFQWYHDAEICLTYLSDVVLPQQPAPGSRIFRREKEPELDSDWFSRGWTLQELLSPRRMMFYDKHWQTMGSRQDLAASIEQSARINAKYLNGQANFRDASIATRMSWMAGRSTEEVEDIAYALLGIFGVNMSPVYGEGIRAFARLQETLLLDVAFEESMFAWQLPPDRQLRCYRKEMRRGGRLAAVLEWEFSEQSYGLLAPSPDCFRESMDIAILRDKVVPRLKGGFRWTNQGVHLELPHRETRSTIGGFSKNELELPLNCWQSGTTAERAVLRLSRVNNTGFQRVDCDRLKFKKASIGTNRVMGVDQMITSSVIIVQPTLPPRPKPRPV